MSAVVTITTMNQVMDELIPLKEKINVPIYMWGARGVGKTTIARDWAKNHGYDFVVLNFANIPIEEALGFPDGKGGYNLPKWFRVNHTKPVFYFLDEINRAPKYVLQGLFNFVNEGRIHQAEINPKDVVVVAGNPDTADYEVTNFEDKAFLSRFGHFYVEPTVDEFVQYCGKHDVHTALIKAAKQFSKKEDYSTPAENRIRCSPDNRSMFKIGQLMNILKPEVITELGMPIFSAMIGVDSSTIVMQCWKDATSIPTIEELFTTKKFGFKATDMDRIAVINSMVCKWASEKGFDEKTNVFKAEAWELEGFNRYLAYIPRDYQAALVKEMKLNNDVSKVLALFGFEYIKELFEHNKKKDAEKKAKDEPKKAE